MYEWKTLNINVCVYIQSNKFYSLAVSREYTTVSGKLFANAFSWAGVIDIKFIFKHFELDWVILIADGSHKNEK